jgi:hypothetical protein
MLLHFNIDNISDKNSAFLTGVLLAASGVLEADCKGF